MKQSKTWTHLFVCLFIYSMAGASTLYNPSQELDVGPVYKGKATKFPIGGQLDGVHNMVVVPHWQLHTWDYPIGFLPTWVVRSPQRAKWSRLSLVGGGTHPTTRSELWNMMGNKRKKMVKICGRLGQLVGSTVVSGIIFWW